MDKQLDKTRTERPAEFPQQDAPIKNTDDAFVRVGKDGQPEILSTPKEDEEKEKGSSGGRS